MLVARNMSRIYDTIKWLWKWKYVKLVTLLWFVIVVLAVYYHCSSRVPKYLVAPLIWFRGRKSLRSSRTCVYAFALKSIRKVIWNMHNVVIKCVEVTTHSPFLMHVYVHFLLELSRIASLNTSDWCTCLCVISSVSLHPEVTRPCLTEMRQTSNQQLYSLRLPNASPGSD
jgi:hypothetical protein